MNACTTTVHLALFSKYTHFLIEINLSLFYFFNALCIFESERDRQRARAGEGQRERETQNPQQAPGSELSAPSPTWGSNPRAIRS